jgi:hypothetical protein
MRPTHSGWQASIRRHLSYANVVATMALVCAMGGSALAANHFVASAGKDKSREFAPEPRSKEFRYVITSRNQISPRVLAELRAAGKAGPRGATGTPGARGLQGATGLPGMSGMEGPRGIEGLRGIEGKPGEPGLSLLSRSEQETLKSILPYVRYVASGVGGRPTIQFSGANVQIVNGEGSTQTTNGGGNLIVGYDENPRQEPQTGSHDLVVGPEDGYTSYGAIVGGRDNRALGPYDLLAGIANETSSEGSSVSGGFENRAAFAFSSIFGGKKLSTKAEYEAIP